MEESLPTTTAEQQPHREQQKQETDIAATIDEATTHYTPDDMAPTSTAAAPTPAPMPLKQMFAVNLKSFASNIRGRVLGDGASTPDSNGCAGGGPAAMGDLFSKTDPAVDGDDCLHDCDSCSAKYPRNFKVESEDSLYGHVKGWSVHLLVATGKSDWKREVADEKGSVMEALDRVGVKGGDGGRVMVSASDIPVPCNGGRGDGEGGDDDKKSAAGDYSRPTTVLVLPAFTIVDNVMPGVVPLLVKDVVATAPTTKSPLVPLDLASAQSEVLPSLPAPSPAPTPALPPLSQRPCPHNAIILLCSQRTRDARCGQSAPILRREFERHLRPLGLQRDSDDDRPGGVGVYFISHVGGHKYSANVMVYRRPNAFGQDDNDNDNDGAGTGGGDVGAGQCIWLARIRPEHCGNIVRYTVLKGKVVNPETQLRGGFDRRRGLMSW